MSKAIRILGIRGIPAAHGGFETFAEELARFLVYRGWKVTVYCQEDRDGPVIEDEWRGVQRIRIPVARRGALGTIIFDWKSIQHAARSRELCLTLGYNTAVFCSLLRARGVPNVINMDGIEWKRRKWGFLAKLWFYLNEWAGCLLGNHLIADHPEIARHLRTRPSAARKITMIPYGGEALAWLDDLAVRNFGLSSKRYLTIIARPEPENSILEMVTAFSSKVRNVSLVILGQYDKGNPYCRAVLQAASSEVIFLGPIYEAAVVRALRYHCLVYLHGHQVGGTNPSLVEALGAGNAVIAHDNKFNRWVAGPTAKFFTTIDECSKHLDELLVDEAALADVQLGCTARFQASFTWPVVLERYETLLAQYTPQPNELRPTIAPESEQTTISEVPSLRSPSATHKPNFEHQDVIAADKREASQV